MPRTGERDLLTTDQAARLLGVKRETIYAYVSRGVLTRHPGHDHRSSRFDRVEVERLARHSRPTRRTAAAEVVIDSQLVDIDPAGALRYRGHDATQLARTHRFEDAADILWDIDGKRPWHATPDAIAAAQVAQRALPPTARPVERTRCITALLAATDPLRHDRAPAAVAATARGLIATIVDTLPERSSPAGDTVAHRLWSRLASHQPTPAGLRALDAALVLCADHELTASTLAARVAASAWSDPYLVVLSGLSAAGGPLHGASATAVEELLRQIHRPQDASSVVGALLRNEQPIPGFGHAVYTAPDPRATTLLALVDQAYPDALANAAIRELLSINARRNGPPPNIDLALGALTASTEMIPGAGEAIFLSARIAGIIAHALEEYPHRLRIRGRCVYIGPSAP